MGAFQNGGRGLLKRYTSDTVFLCFGIVTIGSSYMLVSRLVLSFDIPQGSRTDRGHSLEYVRVTREYQNSVTFLSHTSNLIHESTCILTLHSDIAKQPQS